MKKKFVIVLAIIVLAVAAWFYGYYTAKSNDNLPALDIVAEMEEEELNELLAGYRKVQLREVWQEPSESRPDEDVWRIEEKVILIVQYNDQDKVVACERNITE